MPEFIYATKKSNISLGKLVAIIELVDDINSSKLLERTLVRRISDEAKKPLTIISPWHI